MSGIQRAARRGALALVATTLLTTQFAWAQSAPNSASLREREPGGEAIAADLLVARPLGAAITAIGLGAFIVSLPFTVVGGNVAEAGNKLVVEPGKEAFVRCLGCKKSGWRGDYAQQ
jgi:hypothetical protein